MIVKEHCIVNSLNIPNGIKIVGKPKKKLYVKIRRLDGSEELIPLKKFNSGDCVISFKKTVTVGYGDMITLNLH